MIGGPDFRDIPDTDNDEVRGSWRARDSPKTTTKVLPRTWGKGMPKIISDSYIIDFTIFSLFP